MTDNLARWLLGTLVLMGLSGIGLTDHDFDPNDPWFFIGLAMFLFASVCSNAVLREWRMHTLSDEFEAGYRVGYRAGRRLPLTVTRPTGMKRITTDPIPLRKRATQDDVQHKHTNGHHSWPDSGSSRQGSTRRR